MDSKVEDEKVWGNPEYDEKDINEDEDEDNESEDDTSDDDGDSWAEHDEIIDKKKQSDMKKKQQNDKNKADASQGSAGQDLDALAAKLMSPRPTSSPIPIASPGLSPGSTRPKSKTIASWTPFFSRKKKSDSAPSSTGTLRRKGWLSGLLKKEKVVRSFFS